ncbi:2-oxoacid:acceptor oxidoreductase family protein [Ethanoligenens sp.]|uniref:2-oxoacid:acceptor oxidoreductase family protein n=1 Tax=Ethanoligenens sp. TaxID=2099655 RepID=UPI0039E74C09
MTNQPYDIYIVGVGGQGVLTIAEIISDVAFRKGIPVNYFPTKGMAQRGGFVKAQLRLGHTIAGPSISAQSADLVISMELSESLKAVPFLRPGGEFMLYANRWEPTAVMLGKAPYPTEDAVAGAIEKEGGRLHLLSEASLPRDSEKAVRPNIFVMGALLADTRLNTLLSAEEVEADIAGRWPKAAEANRYAFREGMKAALSQNGRKEPERHDA